MLAVHRGPSVDHSTGASSGCGADCLDCGDLRFGQYQISELEPVGSPSIENRPRGWFASFQGQKCGTLAFSVGLCVLAGILE